MKFKSEYELRMLHGYEHPVNWDIPKRPRGNFVGMFTPMGYDDYHKDGRLVQERESFEEQKQRVEKMVKQQNKL
jgi:hypothetical protein